MAFLGDFGKFFGLGSSKEVLGDVGGAVGQLVGLEGAGRKAGEFIGQATSSIGGGSSVNVSALSTADQALEQSAVPVSVKGNIPQETSINLGITGSPVIGAGLGSLPAIGQGIRALAPQISKFLGGSGGAIATGLGTGVAVNMLSGQDMKQKPVLTQSRRNKARVRQLVNFMGIDGAANFLSQASGVTVTTGDVVQLLLRTFRNDGAYITKAQVRNLRRTTNRFKSLEKQVKEATSMARTTRRASPMRRASSTTLIKN